MPLPKEKQKKFQETFNQVRKDAIIIVSGYGTPAVVDISRTDIFNAQSGRIQMLREQIANVFGASNAEMNLAGTESTNGRNTS
jgi:cobyric acid synthase